MNNLYVQKKNKSIEEFNQNKIYKTCKILGIPKENAWEITERVVNRLLIIQTSRIRRILLDELRKVNDEYANDYLKYDIEQKH